MCKDPILQGLRDQYVKWVGEEGAWYALFLDEDIDAQVNVRSTGPLPEDFPDRQYITGVSILSQGHSLVFEVIDPYSGETPGCPDGIFPCLVEGGIRILVDGEESNALLSPTRDETIVDTFEVSSSNLPTECREFGGGKEWAHVYSEKRRGERELAVTSFEDWVMLFPHMVAPQWCAKYISENGLADVQSKQAVIKISMPDVTVRFSIGVNHRSSGKVDRFGRELPELDFWQTSVALIGVDSNNEHLTGMLGETARPVRDKNDHVITKGLDALRGTISDYRVSGPLGTEFALLHE